MVSLLLQAEFGPNVHREHASPPYNKVYLAESILPIGSGQGNHLMHFASVVN